MLQSPGDKNYLMCVFVDVLLLHVYVLVLYLWFPLLSISDLGQETMPSLCSCHIHAPVTYVPLLLSNLHAPVKSLYSCFKPLHLP